MACHLGLAGATARAPRLPVIASASTAGEPARRIIRRRGPPGQQGSTPAQPSVAEVRRALGVEATASAASRAEKNSAFMELIASTPIGQPEGEAERRLREAAEWVVDTTETRACEGEDVSQYFIRAKLYGHGICINIQTEIASSCAQLFQDRNLS
jgi:hypothetical protein